MISSLQIDTTVPEENFHTNAGPCKMTKTSGILERSELILESKSIDRAKSLEICSAVNFYFANGRPREFRSIEAKIRSRFAEIIQNLTIEEG